MMGMCHGASSPVPAGEAALVHGCKLLEGAAVAAGSWAAGSRGRAGLACGSSAVGKALSFAS